MSPESVFTGVMKDFFMLMLNIPRTGTAWGLFLTISTLIWDVKGAIRMLYVEFFKKVYVNLNKNCVFDIMMSMYCVAEISTEVSKLTS